MPFEASLSSSLLVVPAVTLFCVLESLDTELPEVLFSELAEELPEELSDGSLFCGSSPWVLPGAFFVR